MRERLTAIRDYIAKVPLVQASLACVLGAFFPWWISILSGIGLLSVRKFRYEGISIGDWWWIGFVVIGVRLLLVPEAVSADHISALHGREVMLEGVVTADIVMKPESANVVVEVREYCKDGNDDSRDCREASGMVQTWFPRFPRVAEGDIVILTGRLEKPEDFTEEFSYVDFLRSKDIYSVMYRPNVRMTGAREIPLVKGILFNFRDSCIRKVNSSLPEPHASLLAGMLFGVRRGMPREFADALRRTGTTHIIAASGYNVTVVVQAVFAVLSFLHRRARIMISIGAVWCFVLLAGASPPVVRAGIMGTFTLAGVLLGSPATIHIGLPLSAAIMIVISPEMATDIGFQLSFLSSFGLVYGVPVLKRFLGWIPEWLEESTTVTMAAFIGTGPLIAYHFGTISLLSIPVNFLVIPTVSYIMAMGIIVLMVPSWLGPLSMVASFLAWVPLKYFISVIDIFAKVSIASIDIGKGRVVLLAVSYVLLLTAVIRLFPEKSEEQVYLGQ